MLEAFHVHSYMPEIKRSSRFQHTVLLCHPVLLPRSPELFFRKKKSLENIKVLNFQTRNHCKIQHTFSKACYRDEHVDIYFAYKYWKQLPPVRNHRVSFNVRITTAGFLAVFAYWNIPATF